jgi:prepilin-type N-terminal cleavage/methylation domain-containing protein
MSWQMKYRGFTLIEMTIAIVVAGILATVALRSMLTVYSGAKVEETKQELESLAYAIAGNPSVTNNGERSDFGYVGDVGALPSDLDALYTNPGGYTTWKGPYVANKFSSLTDDYKRDAWGGLYTYSGGLTITSSSDGNIIRQVSNSTDELLRNSLIGSVVDVDGTPPGLIYKDSIGVTLIQPDGTGSYRTQTAAVDASGYFTIDSIPIGIQTLTVVYRPLSDTLSRVTAVTPGSTISTTFRLENDVWYSPVTGTGSLTLVPNSDTVSGTHCNTVSFWLTNSSGSPATITTIKVGWSSPTAYYSTIVWNGTTVFNQGGSPRGEANTTYTLSAAQTVNAGQTIKVSITDFRTKNNTGGGPSANMNNVPMTVTLSGGSVLSFSTDNSCS